MPLDEIANELREGYIGTRRIREARGHHETSCNECDEWKHDYLEVSLLADLTLDLGEGDRAWLHLLAGPALASKRSCQVTAKVGERTVRDEDCTDEQRWKPFKGHDYGIVGGAEVEFRLSDRLGATLGALYTYGLVDLNDSPDWDYVEKNRNLTLRAGLQASIGRR